MSLHPERDVRLAILRDLEGRGNLLTPEESLIYATMSAVVPPPTIAEIKRQLLHLQTANFIVGVNDALGGPPKYKLTRLGQAELDANH